MDRLAGIPGMLIHGRLDVSSPLVTAWRLHQAWPGSELIVVGDEGHGGDAMIDALADAVARFAPVHDPASTGPPATPSSAGLSSVAARPKS
jgi:proline iminopeptidase